MSCADRLDDERQQEQTYVSMLYAHLDTLREPQMHPVSRRRHEHDHRDGQRRLRRSEQFMRPDPGASPAGATGHLRAQAPSTPAYCPQWHPAP